MRTVRSTEASLSAGPVSAEPAAAPEVRQPGALRRAVRRWVSTADALDDEELRQDATEAGATPVVKCQERQVVCVAGILRTVTMRPRAGVPALEAELWDGSGTVDLVWLGRRRIAGIAPGRVVKVSGRMACQSGRLVMFNPRYDLRPEGS